MGFRLCPSGIYEDEDFYWFSEFQFNAFYRVDKSTMKAELLFHFPEEELGKERLFGKVEKVGEWFVFSPTKATKIVVFHQETREIKQIPLKTPKHEGKIKYLENVKFGPPCVVGDVVYFIPTTYPAIVKLDLTTMTIDYLDNWIPPLEEKINTERNSQLNVYFLGFIKEEKNILLSCGCSNVVMTFDQETEQVEINEVIGKAEAFNGIAFDGQHYWLIPKLGANLTKWNRETGETQRISLEESWPEGPPMVVGPLFYKKKMFLSAGINSFPYEVDIESGVTKKMDSLHVLQENPKEYMHLNLSEMFNVRLVENNIHFNSGRNLNWYAYNIDTRELSCKTLPADEGGEIILRENDKKIKIMEHSFRNLEDFCGFVKSRQMESQEQGSTLQTIGQTILDATT